MKRYDPEAYARIPESVSRAYIRAARNLREEPMGKTKLSAGLVLLIVLALAAMTAVAAVLLSGKDFVDQVMRPKAQEDISIRWSQEEVEEILRIAEENGLALDEAQQKQLLSGDGSYKDELMRIFIMLDLGKDPSVWRIEDQYWYAQLMEDIGIYNDKQYAALPEGDEATEAEMLAVVQAFIRETYDPEAPLDDEHIYRRHTFYLWMQENRYGATGKRWYVTYEPLDLEHPWYRLQLDSQANILRERMQAGILDGEEPATPTALAFRYGELYGTYDQWDMETWVAFRQMLLASAAVHGLEGYETLSLLARSDFALPEAGALSQAEATEAALAAVSTQPGFQASAVLPDAAYGVYLLDGEAPVWKVTLPAQAGDYTVEMDARSGEARHIGFLPHDSGSVARHFILESAYQAATR